MSRLNRLIQEIHRRSLWQVLGIYLVGAWVAFQGIEALVSGLGLPEWVPGLAVVILITGLPIVLATAFVREGAGEEETPGEAEAGNGVSRLWMVLATTVGVVVLLAVAAWVTWPRPLGLLIDLAGVSGPPVNPALPENPSVVVLPFANLSGDPEQEYFSDGITEQITADLARNPFLFVISRNSAFVYKGKAVKVEDVGRELGVRYVLEGSVRKAGDRVRITAQLIDATTGHHVWSEQYDDDLADIFALQSKISEEITAALGSRVERAEQERARGLPTGNITAYEAVLRGRFHINRMSRKDNAEARRWFERALELNPDYATAYAGLGLTYLLEHSNGWDNLDPTSLDRGEELVRRALALDSFDTDALVGLAMAHLRRGRPREAIAALEKAVELFPNWEFHLALLGSVLAQEGRLLEATGAVRRALRLNPRAPNFVLANVATVNFAAGRREKAVEQLERVRTANPDHIGARAFLAAYYEREGLHDQASAAVAEILRVNPDFTLEMAREMAAGWENAVGPEEFAAYMEALRKAGLPE